MDPFVFVADAGPLVRWSALLVRVIRDLAAALTVGALLLAGAMVPTTPDADASTRTPRDTAFRVAGRAAYVWAVAALVGVVVTFADAIGMPLTDPALGGELLRSAWSFDTTRIGVFSAMGALLVASSTVLAAPTPRNAVWLAALAAFAVGILGLASHTGVSADHETSVNAMGVHLVGGVVWVGGLLGLVVLRPALAGALTTAARRFSSVALVAFVAVGVSGVLAATTRLSAWGDLLAPYGLLIVVKALAFVVLGVAGWWHRRSTLVVLDESPSGRAFFRLVGGEVLLMGLAFGIATALARSAPPQPEEMPDPSPTLALTGFPAPAAPSDLTWLATWRTDWLFLAVGVIAIGLYAAGLVRLRRSGRAWPVRRTVVWVLGWLLFVWATSGPLGVYGRVAFSWHVALVLVEALVVPVLLVLGAPLGLALATLTARDDGTIGPRELVEGLARSRVARLTGNPVVAAALLLLSVWALLGTGLLELTQTTHTGHVLATVWCVVVGAVFAWSLTRPGSARLVVLSVVLVLHVVAGLWLSRNAEQIAPDFFGALHLPWVTDPLADQRRGGVLYVLLAVAASALLASVPRRRRAPDQGEVDGRDP
jgi:putative copper resistance protein D